MLKKILLNIIFLSISFTATVSFYIDLSNSDLPNNEFPSIAINGSWNDWSGFGVNLLDQNNDQIFEGSIELGNGSYEYVIAGSGENDNWSGWGQIIYAPQGSSCDFNPADSYFNYGFTIQDNNIEQRYCAGTCDSDCGGGIQLSCEDESACNFLELGNCQYPAENYNCFGDCLINIDCSGDCGGSLELDECGVCAGEGITYGYCDCNLTNPGCTDTWQLVWSDEFNQEEIDESKWSFQIGTGSQYGLWGWGNGESQYYRSENATIDDGKLIIEAKQEAYSGSNYTSARLRTKDKGDWLYGKISARMKLPSAGGTWPAFWMMPTNSVYGGWPNSGEIDIMEHIGCDNGNVHGTIHCNEYNFINNTQQGGSIDNILANTGSNVDEFHTYSIEWNENSINWYVDNINYFTYNKSGDDYTTWPFDQSFFIILNLAIGGDWGGICSFESTSFPQILEIEYVRVYQ